MTSFITEDFQIIKHQESPGFEIWGGELSKDNKA